MTQTLIIVGSDRPESLESSYARAFRKLGWANIHFWDPTAAMSRVVRGGKIGRLFATFVDVEPWRNKANLELLQLAERVKPDLVLVIGTHGVRGGTLAQVRILSPHTVIYCIYPDSPHNLDDERIHCLPFFDRVTTSSPAWVSAFQKFGAVQAHYLPFAADTEFHQPWKGTPAPEYAHDVSFIGTWRMEREQILEQLTDFNLCVWGGAYWKTRTRAGSPHRARWGGRAVVGSEFAQVCGQSKILLNLMDSITRPGPNMRTFEIPACGGFMLAERSVPVLDLFREDETIVCFDSVDEARDKIRYYLDHPAERDRIAQASYRFVTEEGHTYMNRAQQLIEWFEQDQAAQSISITGSIFSTEN